MRFCPRNSNCLFKLQKKSSYPMIFLNFSRKIRELFLKLRDSQQSVG